MLLLTLCWVYTVCICCSLKLRPPRRRGISTTSDHSGLSPQRGARPGQGATQGGASDPKTSGKPGGKLEKPLENQAENQKPVEKPSDKPDFGADL
jgi:hypothetical protein